MCWWVVVSDPRRALHHHHNTIHPRRTKTHLAKDVDQAGVRHVVGLNPVLRHPRQQRPRALRPLLRRLQGSLLPPVPSPPLPPTPPSCSRLGLTNPPLALPRVVDRRRVVHHVQPPPHPPQRRHQGDDLLGRRCRRRGCRGCTAGAVGGRGGRRGEEADGGGDGAVVCQGQPVLGHVLQLWARSEVEVGGYR